MASVIAYLMTFEAILLIVLTAYGSTGGIGIPDITTPTAQITGPWPDLACQKTDQGCQISQALGFICCYPGHFDGRAINGVSLLNRIGAIFAIGYALVAILNLVTGVPYAGPLIVMFQVMLAIYAYSLFRHGHAQLE